MEKHGNLMSVGYVPVIEDSSFVKLKPVTTYLYVLIWKFQMVLAVMSVKVCFCVLIKLLCVSVLFHTELCFHHVPSVSVHLFYVNLKSLILCTLQVLHVFLSVT